MPPPAAPQRGAAPGRSRPPPPSSGNPVSPGRNDSEEIRHRKACTFVFSPDGRAVPSDDSWVIPPPNSGAVHLTPAQRLLRCDERTWDGGGTGEGRIRR